MTAPKRAFPRPFTDDEKAYIRAHPEMMDKAIALHLGRTPSGVNHARAKMGIARGNWTAWTEDRLRRLNELAEARWTNVQIGRSLKLSPKAVGNKRRELALPPADDTPAFEPDLDEAAFVRRLLSDGGMPRIEFGRPPALVGPDGRRWRLAA